MQKRTQKKIARLDMRMTDNMNDRLEGTSERTNFSKSAVARALVEVGYMHGEDVADGIVRNHYANRDPNEV